MGRFIATQMLQFFYMEQVNFDYLIVGTPVHFSVSLPLTTIQYNNKYTLHTYNLQLK